MFDYSYHVWADGRCAHNGTQAAQGYASYSLETRSGQKQVIGLTDLPGVTTNNQAECVALIFALVDLRGRIKRASKSPRSYSVAVRTDSQLVVGQLTQGCKIKAANPSTPVSRDHGPAQATLALRPIRAIRGYLSHAPQRSSNAHTPSTKM